jgi:hypothetical protein
MKRIKTFTNKNFADWQKELDKWMDTDNPSIISMQVTPEGDSTYPILFVMYDDGKTPANDFAQ